MLDTLSGASLVLYKRYGAEYLDYTDSHLVFIQTTAPAATEANAGAVWMDVSTIPYTTYILSGTQTAEGISYFWEQTDLILVGHSQ